MNYLTDLITKPLGRPNYDLQHLQETGDLVALESYFDDPKTSARKRRRAIRYYCSCGVGGGSVALNLGMTDPAIVPTCIRLLETETDPGIRRWATFGLRSSWDPDAERPLLLALESTDKATRIHALIGLANVGSGAAVDSIAAHLVEGGTSEMAMRALVQIGDPHGAAALRAAAADDSLATRWRHRFVEAAEEIEAGAKDNTGP